MNVLFISRNKANTTISSIVKNQGISLQGCGVNIFYFTIQGKGIKGYINSITHLKEHVYKNNYDIVHAHYSLSAFVASLAGARPLVVSLMGSDVKAKAYYRLIIKVFHGLFWSATIVKSKDMQQTLRIKNVSVIPNGVDFNKFRQIDKGVALKETGWDTTKKHILFAANPKQQEKNFELAKKSFIKLNRNNIELHTLDDVPNEKMCFYYNSSNVVLLTSKWEGSPNVIKEAMACEIPIVSTDVGDVGDVIGKTEGCYIAKHEPKDVAEKIERAIKFGKRTNGRKNISHLDDKIIAQQIISLYKLLK